MIKVIRIIFGWLCLAAGVALAWRVPDLSWVAILVLTFAWVLHGGIGRIRPVIERTKKQTQERLLVFFILAIPFLIGVSTNRWWLSWLSLGAWVVYGIVRDIGCLNC